MSGFHKNHIKYLFWPIKSKLTFQIENSSLNCIFFEKNGLIELFSSSATTSILYILLKIIQYSLPLAFIFLISRIIDKTSVAPETLYYLALIIGLSFISKLLLINLELSLNKKTLTKLLILLRDEKKIFSPTNLTKIVAQDIPILLDDLTASLDSVSLPIFIVLASIVMVVSYGAIGLVALVSLFIYLPISFYLSKASDSNYRKVMAYAARRIKLSSKWIEDGPYLKYKKNTFINKIELLIAKEYKSRDTDSLLRGSDSYIVGFGRILPYLVLILLGGYASDSQQGVVYWLAIPILAAIMNIPRTYLRYKNSSRSLKNIQTGQLKTSELDLEDSNVITNFDSHLIWSGSLANNLPSFTSEHNALLEKFRLIPELGGTPEKVLEYTIQRNGVNLSEGQKLRILLLRTILLYEQSSVFCEIKNNLGSIDSKLAFELLQYISSLKFVKFHDKSVQEILERTNIVADPSETGSISTVLKLEEKQKNDLASFKEILKALNFRPFLFLIPASLISYIGYILFEDTDIYQLAMIFACSIFGAISAIYFGRNIEQQIRNMAKNLLIKGLDNIHEGQSLDKTQVVSRDAANTMERISWYSHDISWMFSLMIFSFLIMFLTYEVVGFLSALIFTILLIVLFLVFVPEVVKSRFDSVMAFDSFLDGALSVNANKVFSKNNKFIDSAWTQEYINKISTHSVSDYFDARVKMVSTKSVLAAYAQLCSDFLILALAIIATIYSSPIGLLIALLTVLLMISADISNVFMALAGFKSQIISVSRLLNFESYSDQTVVQAVNNKISISDFSLINTDISYRSIELELGKKYSFTGRSGAGKSQYLKGIANIVPMKVQVNNSNYSSCNVYYFNKIFMDSFSSNVRDSFIKFLQTTVHGPALLIFDEAIGNVTLNELDAWMEEIDNILKNIKYSLILVDHRFSLPEVVQIHQIRIPNEG